ncbi:hypothetical protein [uncultured Tenacibaculum sp.]|uniref:hypothetical protein n=1 Tax=uncultured Tenacibaculum sp. TaxID=174713 RepID=UPI00261622DC|nr:hypothetical protein [uncultured Tenacibaculum sp.]
MIKQFINDFFNEVEKKEFKENKNSKANFWHIELQEKLNIQYGDENYIGIRKATRLYEKYVEGKDKSVKDPNRFQRNYMAQYLGFGNFEGYINYLTTDKPENSGEIEKTQQEFQNPEDKNLPPLTHPTEKWYKKYTKEITTFSSAVFVLIFISYIYLNNYTINYNCIVWNKDHYERTTCTTEGAISDTLYHIDIAHFKKVVLTKNMEFFTEGVPNYWYGSNNQGKREFFTARGIHPETKRELDEITEYILVQEGLINY